MKIQADQFGNVLVQLREGTPAIQKRAGVILDLNTQGNWIGGIEMLEGPRDFSLQQAVRPFNPRMPVVGEKREPQELMVTYDPEANAAYLYLPKGRRFQMLPDSERRKAAEYSHSINPTATISLDESGELLSILVPTADAVGPLEDFLYLFDVPVPAAKKPKP
jgi:uncharacterized protein YuzE